MRSVALLFRLRRLQYVRNFTSPTTFCGALVGARDYFGAIRSTFPFASSWCSAERMSFHPETAGHHQVMPLVLSANGTPIQDYTNHAFLHLRKVAPERGACHVWVHRRQCITGVLERRDVPSSSHYRLRADQSKPIVDTADTIGAVVGGILPNPLKIVEALGAIFSSGNDAPKYAPSPKHDVGGWGMPMDLEDSAAQQVLNNSVQGGKQRYGVSDGRVYEFQPDNVGGWHGYPVPGNEFPTSVLRALLQRGDINKAEYGKLIKGK